MKLILLLVYLFMTYVNANPCDPNPCRDYQVCAVSGNGYTCACDESNGFWGDTVTDGNATCGYMRCLDKHGDGSDVLAECGEHAICENNGNAGYSCTCVSGYTGDEPYNAPATCFPTCTVADCGANAICSDTDTGHTCECDDGFVFDSGDCIESEPDACAKDEYVKNNTCEKCGAISGNKAGDPVSGEDTACDVKAWFVVLMSVLGVGAVALIVFLVQYYAPERAKRFIYNPV